MPRYKSHARTLSELKDDFIGSIQNQLDHLDRHLSEMKPSATEQSRIARARLELLALQNYWREVDLLQDGDQK
jgi:hypothetical protein